ncbi:hypothetical protein ACVW17_000315 [Bradyrhizobium sp. USDA 4473]
MPSGQDRKAAGAGAEVEHAVDVGGIADQRGAVLVAAEMRVQQFADEGARHDGALVDIERQAPHIDLVDEIGGRLPRCDPPLDQVENLLAFSEGDARGGKILELVGMQMQRLADQERGFGDRIGGAVREYELGGVEAAHRVAQEIEQGMKLAGADLRRFGRGWAAPGRRFAALGHQDLVQRAAAASSWSRASIQLAPRALSSRFQNGALVFR